MFCCKSYRTFRKSLLVVTSLTASEEAHFPQLWSLRKKIPMLKISTKAAIAELFLIKLEIRGLQIYEERTGTRMNYLGIILTFLKVFKTFLTASLMSQKRSITIEVFFKTLEQLLFRTLGAATLSFMVQNNLKLSFFLQRLFKLR